MDTNKWKSVESDNHLTEEEVKYFDSQEKKNIFEGAKFGSMFKTRYGRDAILISKNKNGYVLAVANYPEEISSEIKSQCHAYQEDGHLFTNGMDSEIDIVSKEEPDKRNIRLLAKNSDGVCDACTDEEKEKMMKQYIEGYKDGFYKTHWK